MSCSSIYYGEKCCKHHSYCCCFKDQLEHFDNQHFCLGWFVDLIGSLSVVVVSAVVVDCVV